MQFILCYYGHVCNFCVKTNFEKFYRHEKKMLRPNCPNVIMKGKNVLKNYIFEKKKTGLLLIIITNNMSKTTNKQVNQNK